ncbi:hypothetical protein AHMF7605_11680 [Adhaeribacter arboris]|uniref:Uncharacterized protein n=1 Tax=Adhaeribacter arboris TaxID=2072846 RepID=A0A2T2YF54_9BACT|nr:heparin lyase I family protein [Adhaeribacter arboris]PSR54132.1 hypothetical protein AHMF7605_11680 [Adhaeribacter arboris]
MNPNFKQEVYEDYGFGVSSIRSRFPGGKSGRFEMRADSTVTVGNKGRSEIKINDTDLLFTKRKFAYSIYMGSSDFPNDLDVSDYYCYCMQEHGWDTRTPPRGIFIKGPKMYYKINYGATLGKTDPDGSELFDLGAPPKDRWVDFYWDVNISYNSDGWVNGFMSKPDPVTGVIKLYQIIKYSGPTGYNNSIMADYPKFGKYKRRWGPNVDKLIIYYDEICWGKGTANIRDIIPDKDMAIVYL